MVHTNKDPAGPSVEVGWIWKESGTEAVIVWGNVYIANNERLYAKYLELSTLEEITFTADTPYTTTPVIAWKQVMNRGAKGNYASVYLVDRDGTPHSGSVYLNFTAIGEG